jgi:hypothetical protein
MTGEFNILMPTQQSDKGQIWLIGTREQVVQMMNECYVKRLVSDRAKFTPIVAFPFATGKVMTVLVR